MKRKPVESNCIDEAGYDPKTKIMEVRMAIGQKVYRYKGVTPTEYHKFLESDSKGRYFNSVIKLHPYEEG